MSRDFTELDRQIDNAEAHVLDPAAQGRDWDQHVWIAGCGTYGCLFGNAVLDTGLDADRFGYIRNPSTGDLLRDRHGDEVEVGEMARCILELTQGEADAFSDGQNTIGVLRRLQKDLHDGRFLNHAVAAGYQEDEALEEGEKDE
jgi:hypothetical protein